MESCSITTVIANCRSKEVVTALGGGFLGKRRFSYLRPGGGPFAIGTSAICSRGSGRVRSTPRPVVAIGVPRPAPMGTNSLLEVGTSW